MLTIQSMLDKRPFRVNLVQDQICQPLNRGSKDDNLVILCHLLQEDQATRSQQIGASLGFIMN